MYRDFGLDQSFLDKPTPIAKTLMISRIREAVEEYEPRVEVVDIKVQADNLGRLIPTVEVEIIDE